MSRPSREREVAPTFGSRRHFMQASLGAAAALALGQPKHAFAQDDAALRTLYDAAKKEGEMVWYISLYGDTIAKRTTEAFGKKYPGLQVSPVRRTTGSTFQRLNQDLQTNTAVAGVVSMSAIADYYDQLKARGALMQYTPLAAPKLDKSMQALIDPGYAYPMGAGLMAIAYNSAKVNKADAPKSWLDLADPKWKGKLALSSPAFSGFDAAALPMYHSFAAKPDLTLVTDADRSAEELIRDAPAVVARYFPAYADLYRRRGWTMFAAIDRVYSAARAEARLGFRCRTGFAQVLDAPHQRLRVAAVVAVGGRQPRAVGPHAHGGGGGGRGQGADGVAWQQVDARRPQSCGHVGAHRILVDLLRRAHLHQAALLKHADARGQRHRLGLIVRHVEQRGAHVLLDALELQA